MQVESLFESGVIKMLNNLARVYKEQDLNDQQQQHHHPQVYICVFILLYSRSIHYISPHTAIYIWQQQQQHPFPGGSMPRGGGEDGTSMSMPRAAGFAGDVC